MAKLGCPAWKRQQMRRDIVTSDEAWIDCLDLLIDAKAKPLTRQQMAGSKRVIKAALETVENDGSGAVLRARDAEIFRVMENAMPKATEVKQ